MRPPLDFVMILMGRCDWACVRAMVIVPSTRIWPRCVATCHAQIGRPWNKVFSEICAGIDRRNTVQQHIHQHIRDFIAIDVGVRNGRLVDLAADWRFLWRDSWNIVKRCMSIRALD